MNKRIISCLFSAIFIFCVNSNPQENYQKTPIKIVLDPIVMMNKVQWDIFTMQQQLGEKKTSFAMQDVIANLDSIPNDGVNILYKYKGQIKQILNALDVMGDRTVFYFEKVPIRFFRFNDRNCVLINLGLDTVYNTIRTTPNGRYADVLRACIIPKLGYFSKEFQSEEIEYFGIIITYGSRNFLEDPGYPNELAESGCIITHKTDCQRFVDGEITENELLGNSSIYLSDRDIPFGCKKINIKID